MPHRREAIPASELAVCLPSWPRPKHAHFAAPDRVGGAEAESENHGLRNTLAHAFGAQRRSALGSGQTPNPPVSAHDSGASGWVMRKSSFIQWRDCLLNSFTKRADAAST